MHLSSIQCLLSVWGQLWSAKSYRGTTMKNRRDFLRNTLGLCDSLASAPRLFAARQESGAGMDMKHMGPATQRSSSRIVSVETPDVPQLPWRMDGSVKEFHLIAEPVKQEF